MSRSDKSYKQIWGAIAAEIIPEVIAAKRNSTEEWMPAIAPRRGQMGRSFSAPKFEAPRQFRRKAKGVG